MPELVDAVKKGDVTISAAAKVASLPKNDQHKAVEQKAVAAEAAKLRKAKRLSIPLDPEGAAETTRAEAVACHITARLLAPDNGLIYDILSALPRDAAEEISNAVSALRAELNRRGAPARVRGLPDGT